MKRLHVSMTAPTATVKRPVNRFPYGAWKRARSRRCRLKRRSGTSVANAFIGTTETVLSAKNARPRAGHFFASIRSRPPTVEQPEVALLTPLALARYETEREARNSRDRLERQ